MARRRTAEQLTLPGAPSDCPPDPGLDAVLGGSVRTATGTLPAPVDPGVRERAGRAAKRHGDAWEEYFRSALAGAVLAAVVACWTKVEVPVAQRRVREPSGEWSWKLIWGAKASADFLGCLTKRDRARTFAIECKSTELGRLPKRAIQPQQVAQLDAIADADGVALLAVEFRHPGRGAWGARQYLIPWRQVPWTVARSAEGLDEADAAPWRLQGGALFDRLRGR